MFLPRPGDFVWSKANGAGFLLVLKFNRVNILCDYFGNDHLTCIYTAWDSKHQQPVDVGFTMDLSDSWTIIRKESFDLMANL